MMPINRSDFNTMHYKSRLLLTRIAIVSLLFGKEINAQINLGSFNLNRNPLGDLQLMLGQGGSLFGFGGDRSLLVTVGPGKFGAKSGNGLTLGGERVGVDQQLGVQEGRGLNLGSLLQVGNRRGGDPMNQLSSFLHNIGGFLRAPQPPSSIFPPTNGIAGTGSNRFRPPLPSVIAPQRRVGGGIQPPLPTLIPTVPDSSEDRFIPNISAGRGRATSVDYGDGGSDEIPLSVGSGWDGDGDGELIPEPPKGSRGGSSSIGDGKSDEFVPEITSPLPSRIIQPPVEPPKPNRSRITTEGRRRGDTNGEGFESSVEPRGETGGNGEVDAGKNDGETGQAGKISRRLPVPDGLEMISASSKEFRRH